MAEREGGSEQGPLWWGGRLLRGLTGAETLWGVPVALLWGCLGQHVWEGQGSCLFQQLLVAAPS